MRTTLYYWPGYCSLADHIVLEWVGADYDLVVADEAYRNSSEYALINPSRTVPAIVFASGFILSQNVAILNYLADLYPEAQLNGNGTPESRALVNRWLAYIAADVHKAFSPLLHPDRILGDPSVHDATLTRARQVLRAHFGIFNDQIGDNDWLVENRRSIADPYLLVLLRWARAVSIDLSGYSHLSRYYHRLRRDPAVERAINQEEHLRN